MTEPTIAIEKAEYKLVLNIYWFQGNIAQHNSNGSSHNHRMYTNFRRIIAAYFPFYAAFLPHILFFWDMRYRIYWPKKSHLNHVPDHLGFFVGNLS